MDPEEPVSPLWLSRRQVLAGGLCLCCLPGRTRAAEAAPYEIAPGVYVRRGIDENASAGNRDAIANIGFIVGADAVLVTETGGSLADGRWLRNAIRAITDKPIRYVVLSHVHPDHVFGAGAFIDDDPVFIGHAKLPEALSARGEYYRRGLTEILGEADAGPVVMPTRTVAQLDRIDLGGRTILLRAHGPAHTSCDLSLLDRGSGLLFPADLVFAERLPTLDGSLLGWLKELEVLRATGAPRLVPGHGPLTVEFASAAADLTRYLTALRDGVRAEIRNGQLIDHAVATVALSEKGRWTRFEHDHGRNVIEAYKELEWE